MSLRTDSQQIIKAAIAAVMPQEAVAKALQNVSFNEGRLFVVAIGKAAWSMASAACHILGDRIDDGIVITKYHHSNGSLPHIRIYEAGHPIPDENSFRATKEAINLVNECSPIDNILFLISGGGSALFEQPLIDSRELESITKQLLSCGADITEINTIRKRFSAVKGGKFAKLCEPAHIYSVILSDILNDPLDMIASGPAYPDSSTTIQALAIIQRYGIPLSTKARALIEQEPPHELSNVTTVVTGNVSQLCEAAMVKCRDLGYEPILLTDNLNCEAKEAGSFLASIARTHANSNRSLAFIAGGETVVHINGTGLGGRNQELALSAAEGISGLSEVAIFSLGSDGTDGPTDAAGGYVDTSTKESLLQLGISIPDVLACNDSYHALKKTNGLIITGPTGTNVNDVSVVLIKR